MKTPRVQDFDPTVKIPQLGSPMDNLPSIQKPSEHQILPVEHGKKPESMQTGKDANIQARKPASLQAGKHVNLQTGKQVIIEKYSSYLTHDYKRELKRIAFETDRNEYEVLLEAVEHYLEEQKHPQ